MRLIELVLTLIVYREYNAKIGVACSKKKVRSTIDLLELEYYEASAVYIESGLLLYIQISRVKRKNGRRL